MIAIPTMASPSTAPALKESLKARERLKLAAVAVRTFASTATRIPK